MAASPDAGRPIRLKDFTTVANLFSLARITMAFALPFFIIYADWKLTLVWFWATAVTDFFDGKLARAFNQVTGVGELLDVTVDRTIMIPCMIVVVMTGMYPTGWFPAIAYAVFFLNVASGDILVLIGVPLFIRMKRRHPNLVYPSPPFVAKLLMSVQLIGMTLILTPLDPVWVATYLVFASIYNVYAAGVFLKKALWIFTGDVKQGLPSYRARKSL